MFTGLDQYRCPHEYDVMNIGYKLIIPCCLVQTCKVYYMTIFYCKFAQKWREKSLIISHCKAHTWCSLKNVCWWWNTKQAACAGPQGTSAYFRHQQESWTISVSFLTWASAVVLPHILSLNLYWAQGIHSTCQTGSHVLFSNWLGVVCFPPSASQSPPPDCHSQNIFQ